MCLTKKSESLQFQSASRLCVWVFHGSVFFFHSQDQSLFNLAAAGCNSCRAQGLCIPKPNFRIGPGNFYMCILYHSHRLCSHLCARLQVKNLTSCFWAVWSLTMLIFGAWHWMCCISTIDCWLYTHTFTEDYGTKHSDSMHSSLVYRVKMRSRSSDCDVDWSDLPLPNVPLFIPLWLTHSYVCCLLADWTVYL